MRPPGFVLSPTPNTDLLCWNTDSSSPNSSWSWLQTNYAGRGEYFVSKTQASLMHFLHSYRVLCAHLVSKSITAVWENRMSWFLSMSGSQASAGMAHLENLSKHRSLTPHPGFLIQQVWGGIWEFLTSSQVVADAAGLRTSFQNHWFRPVKATSQRQSGREMISQHNSSCSFTWRGEHGCFHFFPL